MYVYGLQGGREGRVQGGGWWRRWLAGWEVVGKVDCKVEGGGGGGLQGGGWWIAEVES